MNDSFVNEKKIGWRFNNTYSKLTTSLFSKLNPTPVKDPEIVIFNQSLSGEIGLNFSDVSSKNLALIFSGNSLPQ